MKGVIIAGGKGTRLMPLTKVVNKSLLPIYNKPLIYYPIIKLRDAGITNILITSGSEHAGQFLDLLGSGKDLGVKLSYEVQEEPGGIAQALGLAEDFADNHKIVAILGDNIFEHELKKAVEVFKNQEKGAKIFLKEVTDPERFGVPEIDGDKIVNIVEKPKNPPTNYAVTGIYMYDNQVWSAIKNLKPSSRGELEITDVNNFYVREGSMSYEILNGEWIDAGTFDALLRANILMSKKGEFKMKEHLNKVVIDQSCEALKEPLQDKKANGETSPVVCQKPNCRFCKNFLQEYFEGNFENKKAINF